MNSFLIGIFLGHSILQFLEYVVAALVKSVERFKESLSGSISGSNHKKRSQESQVKAVNSTSSYLVIELDRKTMESNKTEWGEQIGKMGQEMKLKNENRRISKLN